MPKAVQMRYRLANGEGLLVQIERAAEEDRKQVDRVARLRQCFESVVQSDTVMVAELRPECRPYRALSRRRQFAL